MYMEDIGQCIMRCIENSKEYCFKIYNDFWKDREHIYSPVFTIESELESELETELESELEVKCREKNKTNSSPKIKNTFVSLPPPLKSLLP